MDRARPVGLLPWKWQLISLGGVVPIGNPLNVIIGRAFQDPVEYPGSLQGKRYESESYCQEHHRVVAFVGRFIVLAVTYRQGARSGQ